MLTLEAVEPHGNTRTSLAVIERYLGLSPGARLDQEDLLEAVARLRESGLFDAVDYFTRPGRTRGALVLVLEVEERGPDLRLGTGNSDLDGWYLIPAALSLDNLTGRGEQAAVQLMIGYRMAGLTAHYRRGAAPGDRTFWGAEIRAFASERVYFEDGVEYAHLVSRGGLSLHLGRRLGRGWSLSAAVQLETADADSTGTVWRDDDVSGVTQGDEVPFAELPEGIAAGVGERERTIWHTDLVLDTRSPERRAGSPAAGLWGRLRLGYTLQKEGDFPSGRCDLRAYRSLGSGVLGLHGRAAYVGAEAPFYDRLYLGGLYTVRGFPSQSLSAPSGDEWLCQGSAEYRAPLLGDAARPRLVGLLFVDAGRSGEPGGPSGRVAVGAGWGFRVRLGWLGYLGTDFAVPLSTSPVDESFHGHVSLGWSF
ncbi:BamA/TamA family outer membrane protein [bacterium]|nr:BamA/TamA family outer membrane protein [bacterium]